MTIALRLLAALGLALVLLPSLVYYGADGLPAAGKWAMLAGTVLYFAGSYLGFRQNAAQVALEEEHTPVA